MRMEIKMSHDNKRIHFIVSDTYEGATNAERNWNKYDNIFLMKNARHRKFLFPESNKGIIEIDRFVEYIKTSILSNDQCDIIIFSSSDYILNALDYISRVYYFDTKYEMLLFPNVQNLDDDVIPGKNITVSDIYNSGKFELSNYLNSEEFQS